MSGTPASTFGEELMLIDGRLRTARSGRTFDVVDPATEQTIGVVADGGPEDLDDAIAAAAAPSTRPTGPPTWPSGCADCDSSRRPSWPMPTSSGP